MSEVRVIIKDELGQSEQIQKQVSSSTLAPKSQQGNSNLAVNTAQAKANQSNVKNVAVAAMLAKQTLNYATSNVGKWTGDSHQQAVVNNITDLASLGALALVNPYVAIATTAFKIGTTAIDQAYEDKYNKIASQRVLARQGFNSVGEAVGYRRNK